MSDADLGFSISPVRRDLPQDHPAETAEFLAAGADYQLVISDRALSGMRREAGASPKREIGGVLVGRHYRTAGQYLVVVEDHVSLPSRDRSAAHFEFDESSIQAIARRLEAHPDQYVVGWYHSHVGGAPFMSGMDKELHGDHFRQPWHVSCVVSAGSWGRPAGFWRMLDGELVEVADYAVMMSEREEPADPHQQFLAACGFTEAARPEFGLVSLLSALGIEEHGPVAAAMAGVAEGWRESTALADVLFLVNVARAVGESAAAVSELDRLSERLRQLRVFGDVFEPVMLAGAVNDRISIRDNECYSYSERSGRISRLDIENRVVIPVRVAARPVSIAHGPDGHAWVLTTHNRLIRMPVVDTMRWLEGDHSFAALAVSVPELTTRPFQLMVTESEIWLRSGSEWHRIRYEQDGETITLGTVDTGALPAAGCILVPGNGLSGADGEPMLMSSESGRLRIWAPGEPGWRLTHDVLLPLPWRNLDLTHACQHGLGWYLLFKDDFRGRLGLFDRDSLALIYQLVRTVDDDTVLPLKAISGDGNGHLYAQAGGLLYRA